jgi:hypothetical protein
MRCCWLEVAAVAALGPAVGVAPSPTAFADQTDVQEAIAVSAAGVRSAPTTNSAREAMAEPWWRATAAGPWRFEQTCNALGAIGWRFRPRQNLNIDVFAGYRYLYADYESIAALEVTFQGPLVGVAFEFAANGSGFVSPDG